MSLKHLSHPYLSSPSPESSRHVWSPGPEQFTTLQTEPASSWWLWQLLTCFLHFQATPFINPFSRGSLGCTEIGGNEGAGGRIAAAMNCPLDLYRQRWWLCHHHHCCCCLLQEWIKDKGWGWRAAAHATVSRLAWFVGQQQLAKLLWSWASKDRGMTGVTETGAEHCA